MSGNIQVSVLMRYDVVNKYLNQMESKGRLLSEIINSKNYGRLSILFPGYSLHEFVSEGKIDKIPILLLKNNEITTGDFIDYLDDKSYMYKYEIIDTAEIGVETSVAVYNSIPKDEIRNIFNSLIQIHTIPSTNVIIAAGDKDMFMWLCTNIILEAEHQLFSLFTGAAYNKEAITWINDLDSDYFNLDDVVEQFSSVIVQCPEAIINAKYVYEFIQDKYNVQLLDSSQPLPDWIPWQPKHMFGFYEFLFQSGYYTLEFFSKWYDTTHDDILLRWLYDV